jgi:hypothetical protein
MRHYHGRFLTLGCIRIAVITALLLANGFLSGCATSSSATKPPVLPQEVSTTLSKSFAEKIQACFRGYRMDIITDPRWEKPPPAHIGQGIPYRVRITLPEPCSSAIPPSRLFVRFGRFEIPFELPDGDQGYLTGKNIIQIPNYESGHIEMHLFYRAETGEIDLGPGGWVVVDTKRPAPPVLRQAGCGKDYYRLEWECESPDVDYFEVQRHRIDSDGWTRLAQGKVKTPDVTMNQSPEGRVRVLAYDGAGNYSYSNGIEIVCDPLKITHMRILEPEKSRGYINDRVVTGGDELKYAYAIEVTANKEGKLMLVNVDAKGYGYRLFPTSCKTGRGFDLRMAPSVPKRYPDNFDENIYYIGLDDVTGMEDIYAILYENDDVQKQVWNWVLNEICNFGGLNAGGSISKGSRELPGCTLPGGKKKTDKFEEKLNQLAEQYSQTMAWKKISFWHSER